MIDDLFGRNVPTGRNIERENLCANFLWEDVTGDTATQATRQRILRPAAQAVFFRGQSPGTSFRGSIVENDLPGSMAKVQEGWTSALANGRPPWSMVFVDLCFYTGRVTDESDRAVPGMPAGSPGDDDPRNYFGLTLLDTIHRQYPELPLFVLSSKPREEVSLEFSRRGALGFIDRGNSQSPVLLAEALWNHGLLCDAGGEVQGCSLPLLLALREARRAARHNENLLIRGERGTGKELLARYIHRAHITEDREARRPFVTVDSAVLSPNLFAAELFGIQPRTATGVDGKIGLVELAHGGDLFLDEVADMLPDVQAAVLRLVQERQITRVGSREARTVDVRILSATNADLESGGSEFRSDLLDRLRLGGTVWLPPLRERASDVPLLVTKFVRDAESQRRGALAREVTPEALESLMVYDWPGNVRELRSVVFDAVNRFPDVEHLVPEHVRMDATRRRPEKSAMRERGSGSNLESSSDAADLPDALCRRMRSVSFQTEDVGQWAGKLPAWQHEQALFLARYLAAALEVTKRRTPSNPAGTLQIHPAAKLITGDAKLTASKAADLVKRLLSPLEDQISGDLAKAYEAALRLRPKSPMGVVRGARRRSSRHSDK